MPFSYIVFDVGGVLIDAKDPIVGMVDLLLALKAKSYKLGIISNFSSSSVLKAYGYQPSIFDTCIFSGEVGLRKPDPQIFELFCQKAEVLPKNCVYIDNYSINVISAQKLGMKSILFLDPPHLKKYFKINKIL